MHNFDLHYMTFFEEAMGNPNFYTFTIQKRYEHPTAAFLIVRPYNSHLYLSYAYNMKLVFVVILILVYFVSSNAQKFSQNRLWRGNGNKGNNNEIGTRIAFGERSRNFFGVAGILNVPKKFKLPKRKRKCLEWLQQPITNRWKCVKLGFTENQQGLPKNVQSPENP